VRAKHSGVKVPRALGRPRRAAGTLGALGALWLSTLVAAAPPPDGPSPATRIGRVLAATPLIDGHNDLPWEIRERFHGDLTQIDLAASTAALAPPPGSPPLMTDIPRLRQGLVGAQFWSVWVPADVKGTEACRARSSRSTW